MDGRYVNELEGKVAVVTGAASGIGRATATKFATEGMRVVLADIEEKSLEATAAAIAEVGGEALSVVTDVSKSESMDALAARALDAFGAVHLVHLNAGVAAGGSMWELTPADWQWVLGVNLWGVIHGVRSFVPIMLRQGEEGHVVNTASMAGLTSSPFMGPYNVSKHGVVTLSEGLQRELALQNAPIGVSVLCPGWVNTGIGDSSRNRPDDLRNEGDSAALDLGQGIIRQFLESGLDPSEVADQVVDAVRRQRFYVLTHPEWKEMIRQRMDDILDERTPAGFGFLT